MAWFSPAFYPSEDLRALKAMQKPSKGIFTHEDTYFGNNPFRPTVQRDTSTPLFDIRETKDAYFLEGEFPGIAEQKAIKLEWKGKRTLAVEAQVPKLDLEAEWGIKLPKPNAAAAADGKSRADSAAAQEPNLAELKLQAASAHNEDAVVESPGPSRAQSRATSPSRPHLGDRQASHGHGHGHGHLGVPLKDKKHRSSSFFSIKGGGEKPPRERREVSPVHDWTSERHTGTFRRTFCFPEDVVAESLQARLVQGLLKIYIRKTEPVRAATVPVEIQFGE